LALSGITETTRLVAGNLGAADISGDFTSLDGNLIGDQGSATWTAAASDQVGTSGSPIDARLAPLADNGGATMTHALLSDSTAIDAGYTRKAIQQTSSAACSETVVTR